MQFLSLSLGTFIDGSWTHNLALEGMSISHSSQEQQLGPSIAQVVAEVDT